MDRRAFLTTSAAGLFGALTASADEPRRGRVSSDVAPLRRVLVQTPGSAAWWPIPEEDAARAAVFGDERYTEEAAREMWAEGVAQHRRLVALLTGAGAEVVHLERALDGAIARCRAAGRFDAWVLKHVPALADEADRVTGADLLESAPYPLGAEPADEPEPLPLRWSFYTRDVAAATPQGLVVSRFINQDRIPEPFLLRLALEWSPELRRCPVAFDAAQANVNLQGGDLVVVDEHTVFLGVGSLTDRAAAPKLARALKMDVVSVELPPDFTTTKWYNLRKLFLHLDTVFGLLAPKTAVTLPYVFESKFAERRPLEQLARVFRKLRGGDGLDFRKTMRILRDVGRVRRFAAGSGEPEPRVEGMKLVDYLRSEGYRLVFVGGDPPPAVDPEFVRHRVVRELRAQAANVVALAPGRVIVYEGNAHTARALEAAGIDVAAFPGAALAQWRGGPHCMTLPLERGS